MKIQHKLTLDLQQRTNPPILHLKQGDCMTRELLLTLTNDGEVWTPPQETVIFQIAYCKMDRTGGCYDTLPDGTPACTTEETQLLVQLHPQMLTVSGFVICELRMLNEQGAQLSTFSFFLNIEPAATAGLESADYYRFTSLEQLRAIIGELTALQTEDKSSLVAALNELCEQTEIPAFPESLPADGGNADTVSGKTAEEIQQEAVLAAMKAMILTLEKAKESGEFDGEKGDKGDTGEQGPKGDDYVLTDADKEEIAEQAAATATTAATKAAVAQVAQEHAQFATGVDLGTATNRKMLASNGIIKDIGNSYLWTVEALVVPGAPYHIRASTCSTNCFYAIADANGTVIAKENATGTDFVTYYQIEKTLIMPANAAILRVTYYTDGLEAGYIRYGYPNIGSRFAGKKWTAFGDSLTATSHRTDILYHDYIAAELGLVVTNKGQGGTGFKKREDENYAFYQRAQSISTDADIVTIMGGANDVNSTAEIGTVTDTGTDTICGCINTTLDTVINLFLNAGKIPKIGVITSPPLREQMPSDPSNRLSQISDVVIEICRRRSIPCLDLFHGSNLRPDLEAFRSLAYSKDDLKSDGSIEGVHPNEIGHRLMASIIRPFIETLL